MGYVAPIGEAGLSSKEKPSKHSRLEVVILIELSLNFKHM